MIIQVCVGSSCYLKGSKELAEMFQKEIEARSLNADITLAGCFCTGKCNREGVTIIVDDTTYIGITPDKFRDFFEQHVLKPLSEETN